MDSPTDDQVADIVDRRPETRSRYRVDAFPLAIKRARIGSHGHMPAAVARPRSTADASRVVAWASARGLPVVPWGGGSSVTGAPLPGPGALVLDMRGLDRIVRIDAEAGHAVVEAGVIGGDLERELAQQGLTTWLSPQSLDRSTVGGWVATRATGQFSSRFGGIEDAVAALTVVLADGSPVTLGTPPRAAVGPDLKELFIGSEGAFGIVTEVTLRIHEAHPLAELASYAMPTVDLGLESIRRAMSAGLRPALCRLYDADEASYLDLPGPSTCPIMVLAFAGLPGVAAAESEAMTEILTESGAHSLGGSVTQSWLSHRFDFSRVEGFLAQPGGFAETIEIADGWRGMPTTYRALKAALAPLADEVLGHFSHAYTDGISLYLILTGSVADDRAAVERLEAIWEVTMRVALEQGAAISHHHGVGQARAPFLAEQLGPKGFALLRTVKGALDPRGALHPGSLLPVVDAAELAR